MNRPSLFRGVLAPSDSFGLLPSPLARLFGTPVRDAVADSAPVAVAPDAVGSVNS